MADATTNTAAGGAILAAVIDSPDFGRYLHAAERPERLPLQIVDPAGGGLAAGPLGGRVAATVVPAGTSPDTTRAQFIVDKLSIAGDSAQLSFRFPVEGLAGTAALDRTAAGSWAVRDLSLVEH